ncbi:transposase [Streptomyces ardesiacus]|uniref:transposase n=1 Tax=Streptomyces ardesiacus TaxID=285564 RepID=UPI003804C82B
MYKLAKDLAVKARTQAINQPKAVLVIADPALRERLSSLGNAELFRTCARLGPSGGGGDEDAVAQATHMTLRMLAERIEQLTAQIDELNQRLTRLVEHHAPQLLEPAGIGPDSAVTLLITMGDNPERLNTEASFAAVCRVSPIPAPCRVQPVTLRSSPSRTSGGIRRRHRYTPDLRFRGRGVGTP